MGKTIRLHKYMAQCGIASRRECEKIIESGIVTVNGKQVTTPGSSIDCENGDVVKIDGKIIREHKEKIYIMFYKPTGVVTTAKDQFGRKCVTDYFEEIGTRIFSVGRLDYDTEGLLLMTNDGDFMYRLTHPKYEANKVYIAQVEGRPDENALRKMGEGIVIDGKMTRGAQVKLINKNTVEITIHEGRNRQVRRICEESGHPVVSLKRISVGNIKLDLDKPGQWRYLTKEEASLCFAHF